MFVLATFVTTHFETWKQTWQGRRRGAWLGNSIFNDVVFENEGALALFDLERREQIWHITLNSPAGFVVADDSIFVASMYGHRILRLDRNLAIRDALSHRLMNDLHAVSWTGEGVMVTSCGVDAILELSPEGHLIWSWLASENGYPRSVGGAPIDIDPAEDYRTKPIFTRYQSTHCNSAFRTQYGGRDVVLATLFHQGELILIDRATGAPTTLLTGMRRPHAIRPRPDGGWTVCDSGAGTLVLLDEDFRFVKSTGQDFDWVQDGLMLDERNALIADANNRRLATWDVRGDALVDELPYSSEWKVFQIELVPAALAGQLVSAGMALSAGMSLP